jgi:hypothetical protein
MENITRAAFNVQYGLFKVSFFGWSHSSSAMVSLQQRPLYFCPKLLIHVTTSVLEYLSLVSSFLN